MISSACCSMVASILAKLAISVPISSCRTGTAGNSDARLTEASWAAREIAVAMSQTTKPPPAISRPVNTSNAGRM